MPKPGAQHEDQDKRGRERWRTPVLLGAALLAAGGGAAYGAAWFRGLRGLELLDFTTLYVALPLALSLILLFCALRRKPEF